MTTLKELTNLFRDLYIGCQVRGSGDLSTFFSRENHDYPPSLSGYGKLRHGQKSDFMECLRPTSEASIELDIRPETEAVVVDGAAWVHLHSPRESKRFEEYTVNEVIKPLLDIKSLRCDIVFDICSENSLKGEVRDRRGQQFGRYFVRNETLIPPKFKTTNEMRPKQNTTIPIDSR